MYYFYEYFKHFDETIVLFFGIIDRPGVAGAVLQTASSFID